MTVMNPIPEYPLSPARVEELRPVLERLYTEFHRTDFLESDPVSFAHEFDDPADREVAALIAAAFAFGNVTSIKTTVRQILKPLRPHPAQAIAAREPGDWARAYPKFVYRWVRPRDLRHFLAWTGGALREYGSLGALWQQLDDPNEETVLPTLQDWIDALTAMPTGNLRPRRRTLHRAGSRPRPLPSGAHLLLTPPDKKSACKRMNMFLRWVARPADGIDLGLWSHVSPARLVMPVDTHVLKAARVLGLTQRPTADLRTALEITRALRQIDPADPVRFDFALVRPGILRLEREMKS